MAGEDLDYTSVPATRSSHQSNSPSSEQNTDRPYLGVKFECCQVYQRVYMNRSGDAYSGRCPRCGKQVQFRVGPGGTNQRFFTAR